MSARTEAPLAHRIQISAAAETAEDLAAQLRSAADAITAGGFGLWRLGRSPGVLSFSYSHDPGPLTSDAPPQT